MRRKSFISKSKTFGNIFFAPKIRKQTILTCLEAEWTSTCKVSRKFYSIIAFQGNFRQLMVKFSLEHISVRHTSNKMIIFIKQHKSCSSEMIALHQWRQEQGWEVQWGSNLTFLNSHWGLSNNVTCLVASTRVITESTRNPPPLKQG